MAYAETSDVQARMSRTMSESETAVCAVLLEDAAVMIDACTTTAAADARKIVSCRMVIRALGDGGESSVPIGATQGSMTAGPYAQQWTLSSTGGSAGELYLSKADRAMLGAADQIGAGNPLMGAVVT